MNRCWKLKKQKRKIQLINKLSKKDLITYTKEIIGYFSPNNGAEENERKKNIDVYTYEKVIIVNLKNT